MSVPDLLLPRCVCKFCGKDFVEVTQAELPVRAAMLMAVTGQAPKIADHSDHANHPHFRCATPSCAALMPPGWCFCLVFAPEIQA